MFCTPQEDGYKVSIQLISLASRGIDKQNTEKQSYEVSIQLISLASRGLPNNWGLYDMHGNVSIQLISLASRGSTGLEHLSAPAP